MIATNRIHFRLCWIKVVEIAFLNIFAHSAIEAALWPRVFGIQHRILRNFSGTDNFSAAEVSVVEFDFAVNIFN